MTRSAPGATKHELYSVYWTMRSRCENDRTPNYPRYGGRGIRVCPEWVESFDQFVSDVGQRPPGKTSGGQPKYTLDRIDNDGNYEPGNVRWATAKEQSRNKHRPVRDPGTWLTGEEHPQAKLTESDVLSIVEYVTSTKRGGQVQAASKWGVGKTQIQKIMSGESWGWLTGRGNE